MTTTLTTDAPPAVLALRDSVRAYVDALHSLDRARNAPLASESDLFDAHSRAYRCARKVRACSHALSDDVRASIVARMLDRDTPTARRVARLIDDPMPLPARRSSRVTVRTLDPNTLPAPAPAPAPARATDAVLYRPLPPVPTAPARADRESRLRGLLCPRALPALVLAPAPACDCSSCAPLRALRPTPAAPAPLRTIATSYAPRPFLRLPERHTLDAADRTRLRRRLRSALAR